MPTYEYRCKDCSHQFDIVQSFADDALTECPECGGTLKKVFGNVGISFKGDGFYKTDSRSSGSSSPSGAKKDGAATTTSDSSSSSTTTKESSPASGTAGSSSSTTTTSAAD